MIEAAAQARGAAMPELYRVRVALGPEIAFVRATWLKSYAESAFAKSMRPGLFHAMHGPLITRILSAVHVRVAVAADDDDVFLGWAAWEPQTLHYAFVKPGFRHMGIGRALLEGVAPVARYTHQTRDGERLAAHHSGWLYNPYMALREAA